MSAPAVEKPVRVIARATRGQSRLVPGDGPEAIQPPRNRGIPFYDVPPKGREFHLTEKELARFRADPIIQLRFPDEPAVQPKNAVVFPSIADALPKGSQERILDAPRPPPPEPSTLPTVMATEQNRAAKPEADEVDVEDDDDDDDDDDEPPAPAAKPAPTPSKAPPAKK